MARDTRNPQHFVISDEEDEDRAPRAFRTDALLLVTLRVSELRTWPEAGSPDFLLVCTYVGRVVSGQECSIVGAKRV